MESHPQLEPKAVRTLSPIRGSYKPDTPSHSITSMSHNGTELARRLDALEEQLIMKNTSQSTNTSTPEAIQHLQDDVTLIKQALSANISNLRHEISSLQQQFTSETEAVEIRSHEEKLHSATRNPSLIRIATGATLPSGLSRVDGYLREADELESLAEKLRRLASKTQSGPGKTYAREAEDAEALAVDLRERAVEAGMRSFAPGAGAGEPAHDDDDGEASEAVAFGSAAASDTQGSDSDDTASQSQGGDGVDTASRPSSDTASESAVPPPSVVWQPAPIRELAPLPEEVAAQIPASATTTTFTKGFLLKTFGGRNWSPGFYFVPRLTQGSLLAGGGFWLLDAHQEPLFPSGPGAHGCALTPVLRLPSAPHGPRRRAYTAAPVFLNRGADAYTYAGMYSPCRAPDHLDHTRSRHIPPAVKQAWAERLCATGRGDWVTSFLKAHLFRRPTYAGPLPCHPGADAALRQYGDDLAAWEQDADVRIAFLRPEDVLGAFEEADAETSPGMRFWCQYLECVDWDGGFFDVLCREAGAKGEEAVKEEVEREKRVQEERKWAKAQRPRQIAW